MQACLAAALEHVKEWATESEHGIATPFSFAATSRVTAVLLASGAALITGLLVWLWAGRSTLLATEQVRTLSDELARTAQELEQTRRALAAAENRSTAAETRLTSEREAAAQRLNHIAEAHEQLTHAFRSLSSDALNRNNAAFLELARTALSQFQTKAEGDLAARQQAIDSLVKPLRESLDKVDRKIGEIEVRRHEAYGALTQQLQTLNAAQVLLQGEAAKLSNALRSTNYVGSWGELQLRRVVELADMLPYCDFCEQESSGALRADMVVRLPGGQRVVVDAKAPVQSYRESLDVTDEATRAGKWADHAARIRSHIDALGAKNYWEQFQPAPEFVVLFVPGDHFLTAALQADNTLLERAISRKVLLATPTTLIALLKAAAYGWRQEAISRNAEEISVVGRQLYDRVAIFAEHLERLGRGLETATKSYNAAVGSFETSLLAGARRFSELGAKGAKELELPTVVETGLRELSKKD